MLSSPEESGKAEVDGVLSFRPSAVAAHSWDTELFILRGADREDLLRLSRMLQDFLRSTPEVNLKDLAYTLNVELPPGGSRLALVAGSVPDLNKRLATAVKYLADPERAQIKDAVGIYHFDRPLYLEGGLALLFPGEGAQYLNMLADLLPHFPEVRHAFDDADRTAREASLAGGLTSAFLIPEDASPEEKERAEKGLRELHNAMLTVQLVDLAMFELLSRLGLKPAAMAGHSMGELPALYAAGCVELAETRWEPTAAAMTINTSREAAGEFASAVLLAVGSGRERVEKIVQEKDWQGIFVAMDNCPHQIILVGLPGVMAAAEKELRARQILCEKLPFDRPYHTPLFEPYLGPVRECWGTFVFRSGRTPVYSGSTGQPFPPEPTKIRDQAVSNYAAPVQFTRLIENMHADGVRIFVECGPRANLTSFAEDSLRGKPFSAIASNVPHRSGPTQLNHLAGQLAAHQVPLSLDHLYTRRDPHRVSWEHVGEPSAAVPQANGNGHQAATGGSTSDFEIADSAWPPVLPLATSGTNRSNVIAQHLGLMEQFLVDQQQVMEAYFARRAGTEHSGLEPREHPRLEPKSIGMDIPSEKTAAKSVSTAELPLLRTGTVLRLEIGKEAVAQRRLDLAEDLFAAQHTVGGQVISRVDPNHHGLPVLPMTFSMELMAEIASLLMPGLVVIGIRNIRLFRSLNYDEDEPRTMEVAAEVLHETAPQPGATAQVRVEIYDLGNSTSKAGSRDAAAQGIVLLAEKYPQPPPVGEFVLTKEQPCRIPVEVVYRNMFHGPLFQGLQPGGRTGEEGIESEVIVLPRHQLLRSDPEPRFLIDPVLLDVSMHSMSSWHLRFLDQTGRVALPIEVEKLEVFGPQPEAGARFTSRGFMVSTSYRHFVHAADMIGPDGNMWCRLRTIKFWRVYLVFSKYSFHGPKDEHIISKQWKSVLRQSSAPACCMRLDIPDDQKQSMFRPVTAKVTLSPSELRQFRELGGEEQKETEWLFGRVAAKDAVRVLWHERHQERLFPADIIIEVDENGRPTAMPRGAAGPEPLPTVSFVKAQDVVAAVAVFGPHAGIDLAYVRPRGADFESTAFDHEERALLDTLGPNRDQWIIRLWCAKQAVARAIGCPPKQELNSFRVRYADLQTGTVKIMLGPALAETYPEWRDATLIANTAHDGDLVVAVSFCERDGA